MILIRPLNHNDAPTLELERHILILADNVSSIRAFARTVGVYRARAHGVQLQTRILVTEKEFD